MDVTTGKGAEESGERRGAEAAVVVGGKASGRQRGERKESSVGGSRYREGRDRKEPKIRGESFRTSEERVRGGGSVKEGHRGRRKDGMTVRAQEGADPNEGMGQTRVREEVARYGRGFERERELPSEMGGTPNRQ